VDGHYNDGLSATDARIDLIRDWLASDLHWSVMRLEPASADASFRRYFRVWGADGATRVVMDAPPGKEDIRPFLHVGALLERCGVHVPQVEAADPSRGLVLLEDLGRTHYLARLTGGGDVDALYLDALAALLRIQVDGLSGAEDLPPYDRATLLREMALMPEWFCERHLHLHLADEDHALLASTFEFLVGAALAQPRVLVHRDYHSRNLMVLPARNPGIVDFQDALAGPVTYDLVSLLKDCYVAWPRERVEQWVHGHHAALAARGFDSGADAVGFLRGFDLVGLQRHLKVLGIFARLWYRDGKSSYLRDLPLTLDYVRDTAARHAELREFSHWLGRRVVPAFLAANARALAEARA
jgi:aminoglycoside/choline kinase family phosphotransferase